MDIVFVSIKDGWGIMRFELKIYVGSSYTSSKTNSTIPLSAVATLSSNTTHELRLVFRIRSPRTSVWLHVVHGMLEATVAYSVH